MNNDTNLADEMFVIAPYQLYGEQLGGEMGSSQSFSASFRFANLVYTDSVHGDIAVEPTFHRIGS